METINDAIMIAVVSSLITGGVTGAMIIAMIKNDIVWIKKSLDRAHQRIDKVAG